MRKVTCKDCGRVYDFDKDDFCPKCGSFNPPVDEGATALERDLLTRFDGSRSRQAADNAQARERQAAPRRTYDSAPSVKVAAPQAQSQYWHGGEPCEEAEPRQGARRGLVALLVAGIVLLFALTLFVAISADRAGGEAAPDIKSHSVYDEIAVGALDVSIDDVRWLALPEDSRLYREGYDILLVDVYVTGGSAFDRKFPVGSAYLAMDGDWYIPAEGDEVLAVRLKEHSVYAVELRDAVWEDPLMGSLVFYVPKGEDAATLCLEQVEKKLFTDGGELTAVHEVPLELPERGEAW